MSFIALENDLIEIILINMKNGIPKGINVFQLFQEHFPQNFSSYFI